MGKRRLSGPPLWLGEMENFLSVWSPPIFSIRDNPAGEGSQEDEMNDCPIFLYSFNAPFVINWIFVLLPMLDIMLNIYTVRISSPFLCKLGLVFQRSAKYEGPVTG